MEDEGMASWGPASCTIFTKTNCPLCDELKDLLRLLEVPFTECDITTRSEWYKSYRFRIPVIRTAAGREYDPPFDEQRLRHLDGVSH
jgi:hypothetical protein